MKILNKNIVLLIAVLSVVFSFGVMTANAEENVTGVSPTIQKTEIQKTDIRLEGKKRVVETQRVKANLEARRAEADNLSNDIKEQRVNDRNEIKAVEVRTQKSSNGISDNIKERREQTVENREIKKAERIEKLNEKAKERITAYTVRIINRLTAAINRMLKLADRIEARIIKLEEKFTDKGLDLSESKNLVEKAREEARNAQIEINSISEIFAEIIDAENPKESFNAIREHIKNTTTSIKNAHKTLVEAIKSVKASVVKDTTEDTTDTNDDDNI